MVKEELNRLIASIISKQIDFNFAGIVSSFRLSYLWHLYSKYFIEHTRTAVFRTDFCQEARAENGDGKNQDKDQIGEH